MKSFAISIILFVMMAIAIAVNSIYINNVTNTLTEMTECLSNISDCKEQITNISDYWRKHLGRISISVNFHETEMITEAAPSLLTYLRYLRGRADKRGILAIGLGDWCHVNDLPPKAPLALTDTVMAMDIAEKTAVMLDAVGMKSEADFARGEAESYRKAIRANLIDFDTMLASGSCQSSQAMCLYYGVFERDEEERAFAQLLKLVRDFDDHIDVGVLGARVIFLRMKNICVTGLSSL